MQNIFVWREMATGQKLNDEVEGGKIKKREKKKDKIAWESG